MPKPFEAEQKCLEELMREGRSAYAIPLYQRRYVWNTEENRKLWEDVVECFTSHTNHFLGSFVLMDYARDEYDPKYQADVLVEDSFTVKHVVDGQQRMTSLSLILAALYKDMIDNDKYFSSLPGKDEQDEQDWNSLKSKIRDCLVSDVRDRESKSHKGYIPHLIPSKSIYEAFKSIVNLEPTGKPQLLVEKAYALHLDNIQKFRLGYIPEMDEGAEERATLQAYRLFDFYNQMYISIAQRMKIVRIDCSAEEDAFQVFESLNGTGVRLTSADRIKNMLMGKGSKEKSPVPISTIESDWQQLGQLVGSNSNIEPFLRAYLFTVANRRISRMELAKAFNSVFLSQYPSVRSALCKLKHAADHYGTIVNQGDYTDSDGHSHSLPDNLKTLLFNISKTNPTQSVVPLLAAAEQYGFEDIRFKKIAERILVLLVRHKVCQKSTNMLDRFFEQFCKDVKDKTTEEVLEGLIEKQPSNAAFETSFASLTFDVGNSSETTRARYYLECIENYLRNKSGDCNLDSAEKFTLEHIIPQTFDPEKWFAEYPEQIGPFQGEDAVRELDRFRDTTINSIGNMCLLRGPENSSAGNGSFAEKVAAYQRPDESGKTACDTFRLVNQIVNTHMNDGESVVDLISEGSTFDSGSVEKRASILAHYALTIWV